MVREIVKFGSKVLRRTCDPVDHVDPEIRWLLQDLFDTLKEAEGVGDTGDSAWRFPWTVIYAEKAGAD